MKSGEVIDHSRLVSVACATLFFDNLFELSVEGKISFRHGRIETAVSTVLLAEKEIVESAQLVKGVGRIKASISVALIERSEHGGIIIVVKVLSVIGMLAGCGGAERLLKKNAE